MMRQRNQIMLLSSTDVREAEKAKEFFSLMRKAALKFARDAAAEAGASNEARRAADAEEDSTSALNSLAYSCGK